LDFYYTLVFEVVLRNSIVGGVKPITYGWAKAGYASVLSEIEKALNG
jgi:hypothetical protein